MSETKRPRLSAAQLRPVFPVLALLCLLLAAWLAYTGWAQWREGQRDATLRHARDVAAQGIGLAMRNESKRLTDGLASAEVQQALMTGDLDGAATRLIAGWPQAQGASIVPPDLDAAYAALPRSGFGRLAVQEAALASGAPIARIARDPSGKSRKPMLLVAAPARAGDALVGVASVVLPMSRASAPLESVAMADGTYLALRQGADSLLERGDTSLSNGAESLSVKIPDSDLRVAAALPDGTPGAFGLGAMASLVGAGVLAALALLAWLAWRRIPSAEQQEAEVAAEGEQTFAEALVAPAPRPADGAAPAEVKEVRPRALPVKIDRSIFRAYDIRGVLGKTLDAGVAELIGHAIGSLMQQQGLRDIVVGRDGRLSGPELVQGLSDGLRKAGCNVIDIGQVPTPVVYFGTYHLRTGCGVAVTGSHNPPDYNGFKIMVGGETLSGDAITDLHARIADDRLHVATTPGTLVQRDIADDYVQRVASDVQIDRPLKVVVDAGNGVAGEIGPRVLEAVGAAVTPMYCEIDGHFPNHHPDPSDPKNLADLVQMVERTDADLGIAFDGDGDRLGVVTRSGNTIYPDRLLMLFAADVLERNPGAVIVYDVKCTGRLPGFILRHGGSPLMWKTGHSLIKAKMRETEAELAGEMSGHFFFGERWYGFDDGIYAAARLLEILAARPESPGEQLDALPDGVSTPEIKVEPPGGDPHAFVEHFELGAKFEGARRATIDGVRVDWPDGWGLVRASNTTPVLVMRFDADSQEALARIQAAFREQLLKIAPELDLPF